MTKKKNKQREPYRKSSRYGKKGFAFIPMLIIFAVLVIILIIVIKNPEICIVGYCWRLVPLRWGKVLMFWVMFASFFAIIGGMFYIYYWVISRGIQYGHRFIELLKKSTLNIEQYFLKITS